VQDLALVAEITGIELRCATCTGKREEKGKLWPGSKIISDEEGSH
jgi:hypothetical protein